MPPMLKTRLQRAVYYSISKMLAGTFQQAQMPENTSRQLQTPLPCLQCWEQGLKELSGTDTAQMPKAVPAASGTIAMPPMLEARPQRAARHCFYSVSKLLAGTFEEASRQLQAPLPCFQCWKQCWKQRLNQLETAGWHVSPVPAASGTIALLQNWKQDLKEKPNTVITLFLQRFETAGRHASAVPETCPGSRHHCRASNAGSKAPKSCQSQFLQRFETAGSHFSAGPNA